MIYSYSFNSIQFFHHRDTNHRVDYYPLLCPLNIEVGSWYFDFDGHKDRIDMDDVEIAISEAMKFIKISMVNGIFLNEFIIEIDKTPIRAYEMEIEYIIKKTYNIESLQEYLLRFISSKNFEQDGLSITKIIIRCNGELYFDEINSFNVEFFVLSISRNNSVSLTVSTRNFCYLPHNPISKIKQYDLWSRNAPRLAKALYELSNISRLPLLTERGELFHFASSDLFYLRNRAITGIDFDEHRIPYDLLKEEQYIFNV